MQRLLTTLFICFLAVTLHAQADHPLDAKTLQNDSIILKEMIMPAIKSATEPDWNILRTTVVGRYDATYGDRSVIKAKIYYFYSRDWVKFCAALVQYTNAYEYKDNLSLMNKNAKMILEHSQDPAEWKAAQGWVKNAVDKAPGEAKYKETYEALGVKIGK